MFSATVRSALRSRLSTQVPRASNTLRAVTISKPLTSSNHHEETFEEFTARYVIE